MWLRGAVGGGADLVGNANTTFAGKRRGVGDDGRGGRAGHRLQARAHSLAVGDGRRLVVQGLNPLAAVHRRHCRSPVQHIVDARGQITRHRAA